MRGVTRRMHVQPEEIPPGVRDEIVAFLRDWLPEPARRFYRAMILRDPANWHTDPHFAGGVIVDAVLRGNGIDEKALGIRDLDAVWPDLLARAVMED
jgi:hypothetical protein